LHTAETPPTGLGTMAVGVIVVAALYFGREVFVPMALAVLLSFALGPPVLLLRLEKDGMQAATSLTRQISI
jgi:predicted PurR-regulated permease PerM